MIFIKILCLSNKTIVYPNAAVTKIHHLTYKLGAEDFDNLEAIQLNKG